MILTIILVVLIILLLGGPYVGPVRPYFGTPTNVVSILLVIILVILILQLARIL
jgi:hypothetical protein